MSGSPRKAGPVCRVAFDADDYHVDDIAISGDLVRMVRLERMSADAFWGAIHMHDGRSLTFYFHAKARRLEASAEWEPAALGKPS